MPSAACLERKPVRPRKPMADFGSAVARALSFDPWLARQFSPCPSSPLIGNVTKPSGLILARIAFRVRMRISSVRIQRYCQHPDRELNFRRSKTIRNLRCHFHYQPIVVMVRRLAAGGRRIRTRGPSAKGNGLEEPLQASIGVSGLNQ